MSIFLSEVVTLEVSLSNLKFKVGVYFVHDFPCLFAVKQPEAYLHQHDRKDDSWILQRFSPNISHLLILSFSLFMNQTKKMLLALCLN